MDISEKNYKSAQLNFPKCDFRLFNGLDIQFEKNSFDTIIFNDVLEHIPYHQTEIIIKKIKDVFKPNGIIYISVSNRYEIIEPHGLIPFLTWFPRIFWHFIDAKLNKVKTYNINQIHPYTFKRIKLLCKNNNLQYTNFTWVYVLHKFSDLNYIGNKTIRTLVKF